MSLQFGTLLLVASVLTSGTSSVLMAELLKHFYPKHVQLHNYSPANSKSTKINNWLTLNNKVLTKLHLQLKTDEIEKLATSVPGAIEELLLKVYNKIYTSNIEKESSAAKGSPSDDGPMLVPIEILEEKNKLLNEKDKTISQLNQKVEHLETLIKFKEQRIDDLTIQLERLKRQLNEDHH